MIELSALPEGLAARLRDVKSYSRSVRATEYHITNACNIRCKGCWFFEHEFDTATKENKSKGDLSAFIGKEKARGINTGLLIGGEPTLFPQRIAQYAEAFSNLTISTNGLKPFPRSGFENVSVGISLFGGGTLDDELRAIKPSGAKFKGLFDTSLKNYRYDERAFYVYALTEDGVEHIRDTVRRIEDNGNVVTFNFYSKYDTKDPLRMKHQQRLLDEALEVRELFPQTVISQPYYIRTMVTGDTHWGSFGYDVCPSISIDHPAHAERLKNGNRSLSLFNAYAPDLETVNFCCTSGHCTDCRDSQAVFSWLLVSGDHFMGSKEDLATWVDIAESYWSQFIWSPYHRTKRPGWRSAGSPPAQARTIPISAHKAAA